MSVNDSQSDVNQPDSFILENGTISHMGLASLTNSRKAGKAALFLCKFLPPALGYRLADAVATQLAADPTTPMFQGIRNNQSAVSLGRLSGEQLEARVLSVLRNITLAFYEQFYFMHRPASLQRKIVRNAVLEQVFSWQEQQRGGLIVCGLHMSSFDLVYQAITQMGLKTVGLSLPEESEAIAWQHQLRRQMGGEIIPATIPNLKRVIHRLQAGEIVVTGIDRPVEGLRGFPLFFGRPARLPVHYIQLAAIAGVPLLLMASVRQPDGQYQLLSSDLICLQDRAGRSSAQLDDAERVLGIAEGFIQKAPEQWTMFHPVWPELSEAAGEGLNLR